MQRKRLPLLMLCGTLVFASFGITSLPKTTHAAPRDIRFPVIGPVSYSNDFGAPRSGGRTHEGNDIMGTKHQLLVAAVTGTIRYVASPEPSWGYSVTITALDGWTYHYLHVNNDNPGTDDGRGGEMNAYAPDMRRGNPIEAGQLIGYMGDSGNAEYTRAHLHFEIRDPNGTAINPYETLQAAPRVSQPASYQPIGDEILPFGNFKGGANIALGEMNGKYEGDEIIVGAGPGGGPHVKVYTQTNRRLLQFFAFEDAMRGGVDVAVGDTDGVGTPEIITAAGENSSPRIRIYNFKGELQKEFLAFEEWFKGGIRVAVADLDEDGIVEILTAPAKDYAPWLKIYDVEGKHLGEFLTYGIGFRGGFDVAAHPATQNSEAMIVTSPSRGGGPDIRVFDSTGKIKKHFFAYSEKFRGGVRVSFANVDTDTDAPEIVTAPANSGGPQFRIFTPRGQHLYDEGEFEKWWRGGYDVAAGDGQLFASSFGNRRTSIRVLD